jgi:hypothetical protein
MSDQEIRIHRYCLCGQFMRRRATDTAQAAEIVRAWYAVHTGRVGDVIHGSVAEGTFWKNFRRQKRRAELEADRVHKELIESAPKKRTYIMPKEKKGD